MPQTSQNGARSLKEGDWNEEGEKGIVIRRRLVTNLPIMKRGRSLVSRDDGFF